MKDSDANYDKLLKEWLTPLDGFRSQGIIEDGTRYLIGICERGGYSKEKTDIVVKQWLHWLQDPLPESIVRGNDKRPAQVWTVLRTIGSYKYLALIARGLLCCPASEAAVERLFSAKRRAINDIRANMNNETLNAKSMWLSEAFRNAILYEE